MFKQHPHTPAHLLLDNTPYFITGAIHHRNSLLVNSEIKKLLLN